MSPKFNVTIWGARGSVASCSPDTVRYGGNTSCVEVQCGDNIIILDAGTGLRRLGLDLAERKTKRVEIMFGHCHYDHISGLPFFKIFWDEDAEVGLWSGHLEGKNKTKRMCQEYMRPPFFPISPDILAAKVKFNDFEPGDKLNPADGVNVDTMSLNHHNGCVGYRIKFGNRSMCYIVDNAHVEGQTDKKLIEFVRDTDLMIYDATYTDEEFPTFADFGHSTWQQGFRMSKMAGAKRYCIFHHRPTRTDDALDKISNEAKKMGGDDISVFVAHEGMKIAL